MMSDMSKDTQLVAKYDNSMNNVPLGRLSAVEQDLFISICALVKEKGTERVHFDFNKLKEITKYTATSNEMFSNDLKKMNRRLLSLNFEFEDENVIEQFVLFTWFRIDKNNLTLDVEVNKRFEFLLNALEANFTRFELKEFIQLRSAYAKDLYRLLKQYRTLGVYNVPIDDFRRLLDVPKSYKIKHIDEKILIPSLEELKAYFHGLKVTKIKSRRRGNPVTHLKFTFKLEVVPVQPDPARLPSAVPKRTRKNKSADLMAQSGEYKPMKK